MSIIKPSDYGVWTRRNCPNLTDQQRAQLCIILSEMRASCVHLLELATNERLHDVTLRAAMSERRSSNQEQRSIAPTTRKAITAKLSRLEHGRG